MWTGETRATLPTASARQSPRSGPCPSWLYFVALGMPCTLQDLWKNLVFSKFPDGCFWGAPCNHSKNHKGWSGHKVGSSQSGRGLWGLAKCSRGSGECPSPSQHHSIGWGQCKVNMDIEAISSRVSGSYSTQLVVLQVFFLPQSRGMDCHVMECSVWAPKTQ